MLKKTVSLISLGTFSLLIGCSTSNSNLQNVNNQVSALSQSTISPQTIAGWKTHLESARVGGAIQKGCNPYYKKAQGQHKGSVMLFHGYSACPQQYDELANVLASRGFNVFVPLLPGHGKERIKDKNGKLVDNYSGLPTHKTTHIYKDFANKMSRIIANEKGTKVVGGLSLGGAIASRAMIDNQDIYSRGVVLAPFFNMAGAMKLLFPPLGKIAPNKQIGWGSGCEKERSTGRAGICSFKVTHLNAVVGFGKETMRDMGKIKRPMQFSGAEKDAAASNSDVSKAKRLVQNSQGCFFEKGTDHSMLSRYDNVGVNMFWLNPLKQQFADYVETGKNFQVVGKSEYGFGLCKSR